MRLIDADRLLNPSFTDMFDEPVKMTMFSRYAIESQPTVKAIPIEWLNKRAEEIAFAYWTNSRNKITLPLNELPLLIDQIIGEWEKENDKGSE